MLRCLAKRNYHLNDKGKATIEWYKDGKPQYYCYGYIDQRNDEPLEECKQCKKFIWQSDIDFDEYLKSKGRSLYGTTNK